ncbi:hypothetical protein ACHAXA_003124 [Cyclostephanos tholiformis]|uniref:C3H1-type domain-containing protein n=1 Tax=Cyclostephanos tholiformis TaxID=382380 RepID=A0ABD3SRZ9_9STRA
MKPRYERNLPKLCSFSAKGECDRGSLCPVRHEAPRDRNDPLSKQNTKDRSYGHERSGGECHDEEAEGEGREGDERAVATLYARFADEGGGRRRRRRRRPEVAYGEISSVRMHADRGTFVEYTTARAAQHAITGTNRTNICGRRIIVNWAREPKRGAVGAGPQPFTSVAGAGGVTCPIELPEGGVDRRVQGLLDPGRTKTGGGGGINDDDIGRAEAAEGFAICRAGASGGDAARGSAPYYPSAGGWVVEPPRPRLEVHYEVSAKNIALQGKR